MKGYLSQETLQFLCFCRTLIILRSNKYHEYEYDKRWIFDFDLR